MKRLQKSNLIICIIFSLVAILFVYKLDRYYFFTDEILYVQKGLEQFQGIYSDTLQVAPLPKYLAGLSYTIANDDLALMRVPYAIISILTSYILYLIIKREYGSYFGLVGVLLYATSQIIFNASRMVMLEPLMHLFWLLFLYFYYETFSKDLRRIYLLSGLFLGLALSAKLTSLVLVPFISLGFLYKLLELKKNKKLLVTNYIYLLFSGFSVGLVGYLHFFYKYGVGVALVETAKAIRGVYMLKSEEGKLHVVGDNVYTKSPWWSYIYYHFQYNGLFRSAFYPLVLPLALMKGNFFTLYWFAFFLIVLLFHQVSGVKNVRYISSFEIPLIVLSIIGLNFLFSKLGRKLKQRYLILGLSLVLSTFLARHVNYLANLGYTEYEGLYRYFREETRHFSEYKRLYVYGSVRSMKHYRSLVPDVSMVLWRQDYSIMCPELESFDYFAFDKEELLKNPDNFLYMYVQANLENFEQVGALEDMHVFRKIRNFESAIDCSELD